MLCCELSNPGASVKWKKDMVLLRPGNKYEMKQNGCELQLKIYDLKIEDCGIYKCCASKVETSATVGVKGLFSLLSPFCSVTFTYVWKFLCILASLLHIHEFTNFVCIQFMEGYTPF